MHTFYMFLWKHAQLFVSSFIDSVKVKDLRLLLLFLIQLSTDEL